VARWLLLVASGPGPLPRLAVWPSVTYCGRGRWVPLPPTELGCAQACWQTPPQPGVPLPPSEALQRTVIDALGGGGSW
jgi:hypothetical protein